MYTPSKTTVQSASHMKEAVVGLTMPLEQAREVIWPFNEYRGQDVTIGQLVDQRRLNAKDLGWAMEQAQDSRMRAAARTMLTYYLGLTQTVQATQRSGPKIIQSSRYLQEKEVDSFSEFTFIVGVAFAFGFMLLYQFVVEWLKGTLTIPVLIVAFVLLAFTVRMVYRWLKRSLNAYRNYRKGREGEDKLAEKLQMYLDDSWTVFRNVVLPGDRKDDLDFVLVGPGGVWVLEVKTYGEGTRLQASRHRNALEVLHLKHAPRGNRSAPDWQATGNAYRLKTLLNQRGIDVKWVQGVVVFPEYCPVDFVRTAEKAEVWQPANIETNLDRLATSTGKVDNQPERLVQEIITIAEKG